MKTLYRIVGGVSVMAVLAGCVSPMGPNQAGGTAVGGATGAIIGGVASHSAGGAVIGGAIGALAGALVGKDIDDTLRVRVVQGQPLSLDDIKALAKANVADDTVISQITATRTVYHLTSAQIIALKDAGVSPKLIDFMISTPMAYPVPTTEPGGYYYAVPPPYPYPYYYPYPVYFGPAWYHGRHRW